MQFDPDTSFVKTAPAKSIDMFTAEADGLRELASANVIRVPEVFDVGVAEGEAFIAMERIHFERATAATERMLGEQLAALHRHTAEQYGWHRDNTIGLTPQHNTQTDDWVTFFREQRIIFQLELAAGNGFGGELQSLGREIVEQMSGLFDGYDPAPSLLHGDLWGGNWGASGGEPVIFDPAVYYGDRESDLAMTRLFGGFGRSFYQAYESAWPLAPGHERRCDLYQLYHLLNHLNLFGSGYLSQSLATCRRIIDGGSDS